MAVVKGKTVNVRVTEEEKAVVAQAAAMAHMPLSQFMLQATLRAAEEVLAEQTRFLVPAEKWDEFVARLDTPARVLPGLRKAASRPSPLDGR